jgi:hypothetical protein
MALISTELKGMIEDMDSVDDLMIVNRLVVRRIRELQARQDRRSAALFSVGERVRAEGGRRKVLGTVTKVNVSKVVVRDDAGRSWLVPASMLKLERG